MDGFANVTQWHDSWWLWVFEHCLARYGLSHTLTLSLSPTYTYTCTLGQYELELAPCRSINLTWNISKHFCLCHYFTLHDDLCMNSDFVGKHVLGFIVFLAPYSRAGRFGWKQIRFDSIRFTSVASPGAEAIYELWSALSNVVAKLLTVISLGLSLNVDAQWRKHESTKHFIKHLFFYFLPERDYMTFGSLLSQIRLLSSVCNIGAP